MKGVMNLDAGIVPAVEYRLWTDDLTVLPNSCLLLGYDFNKQEMFVQFVRWLRRRRCQ